MKASHLKDLSFKQSLAPLAAITLFLALIHITWWLAGDYSLADLTLADGDSYAWLLRTERLWMEFDWFDRSFPRANVPYEGSLHWGRLFDLALIALALPLMPFMSAKAALFVAGFFISPLLHIVVAIIFVWAVLPMLGRPAAYFTGALTVTQFGLVGYATVGHADHHMLFSLFSILALGFYIRSYGAGFRSGKGAFLSGLSLAAGLWVGPEIFAMAFLFLGISAAAWLFGQIGALGRNQFLSAGLALGVALFVLVERGFDAYFTPEYDRISTVYLTPILLTLLYWLIVGRWRLEGQDLPAIIRRTVTGLIGAVIVGTITWHLYPKILQGPMAEIEHGFTSIIYLISEVQPIRDLPQFLIMLGSSIFVIPWLLYMVKREWNGPWRWIWLLVAVGCFAYVLLGLYWLRWIVYGGIFLTLGLAGLARQIDILVTEKFSGLSKTLMLVPVALILVIGPVAAGVVVRLTTDGIQPNKISKSACRVRDLALILNDKKLFTDNRTIVASPNFGPEILYRTNHSVLATVHHRNASGIYDSVRILGGSDMAEIKNIMAVRKANLLIICEGSGGDSAFIDKKGRNNMYHRLKSDDLPSWLTSVETPKHISTNFKLFASKP